MKSTVVTPEAGVGIDGEYGGENLNKKKQENGDV